MRFGPTKMPAAKMPAARSHIENNHCTPRERIHRTRRLFPISHTSYYLCRLMHSWLRGGASGVAVFLGARERPTLAPQHLAPTAFDSRPCDITPELYSLRLDQDNLPEQNGQRFFSQPSPAGGEGKAQHCCCATGEWSSVSDNG